MATEEHLEEKYSIDGLLFRTADYAVFILLLCAAGGFGVYSGVIEIRSRKCTGTSAGNEASARLRDLGVLPVSFSLMASLVASPFVLGTPAETYLYGTTFAYLAIGYAIGMFICAHFFIRIFFSLGITSVYEYIELRFSVTLRRITTLIFASSMLIYMGIIVYSPAIALTSVTGISVEMAVVVVGLIGTVYTSIGGLKGVIWADVIQMLVLISAFIAVIVRGTQKSGGPTTIANNANQGGRFIFNNFSIHPHARTTVWTQIIGGAFVGINIFCNQAIAQKLLVLPSVNKIYQTILMTMMIYAVFLWSLVAAGVVMYGYYHGCDPLMLGQFRPDQFIMIFAMRIFDTMPGLPGLVVAAVFASSLSSVAAGINALTAVTMLDIINPMYKRYRGTDITSLNPAISMAIFKSIAVMYGLMTIGVAFLAQLLGQSLLQLAFSLLGIVGGPMLSIFIMGIFMPWVNNWGATAGCLVSLLMTFWVAAGSIFTGTGTKALAPLPLSRDQCHSNFSSLTLSQPPEQEPDKGLSIFDDLYRISYMWYTLFALLCSLFVGLLVSCLTGNNSHSKVDPSLLHPWLTTRGMTRNKSYLNEDSTIVPKKSDQSSQDGMTNQSTHFKTLPENATPDYGVFDYLQ